MEAAELGDHLLGHPVTQEFLFRITRQVLEWEDGQLEGLGRRAGAAGQTGPEATDVQPE